MWIFIEIFGRKFLFFLDFLFAIVYNIVIEYSKKAGGFVARSMTCEEFIRRAKLVHGDRYDYSDTQYISMQHKLEIRCLKHGVFLQLPQPHLKGQGCPECGKWKQKQTMLEKYGADNAMKVKMFYDQARETCKERYGHAWAPSNEDVQKKITVTNQGRYGSGRPMQNAEVFHKQSCTLQDRYGVSFVGQVPEGIKKRHQACLVKYGTEECLASPEIREKIQKTNQERYGGNAPMCSSRIREKCSNTALARYGVPYVFQSEDVIRKTAESKFANGTFATSPAEDVLYSALCEGFGADDVVRQHMSDEYPFLCDFYIKSRNLYLELNGLWTHGNHWFDFGSAGDQKILSVWQEKGCDCKYYRTAIHVWTDLDVRKREIARKNQLNYVVFWGTDLSDAKLWFGFGCPDGKDWERMYSWMPSREI